MITDDSLPLMQQRLRRYSLVCVIGLVWGLFAMAFLRTAWVAEDAFITFRVVENLLSGHGPVWNVGERVQVFTHPLWLILITPLVAVFGDPFWVVLGLSALLLIAVLAILGGISQVRPGATLGVLALLLLSRAFIEYSSSGLENPLSHLLVAMACYLLLRGEFRWRMEFLLALAAVAYLVRPDLIVLLSPLALYALVALWQRGLPYLVKVCVIAAAAPFAWTIFSLVYYGSPVPNTALAKVGTGVSWLEKWDQCVGYVSWIVQNDQITAGLIVVAVIVGALSRTREALVLAGAVGLWLLYLLAVGGDYMGGRFLSPVMVICAAILISALDRAVLPPVTAWLLLCLGIGGLQHSLLPGLRGDVGSISTKGIADERGYYVAHLGLDANIRSEPMRFKHPWWRAGRQQRDGEPRLFTTCVVGMFGYGAGPDVTIIDPLALTDPFLARLPARPGSRIGHFERAFPPGYLESRATGYNHLKDPHLAELWDLVQAVVSAPIWSLSRLRAIAIVNFRSQVLVERSNYDPSAVGLPGVEVTTTGLISCMGRADPLGFWRLRMDAEGVHAEKVLGLN